jgi:hypothetical protein
MSDQQYWFFLYNQPMEDSQHRFGLRKDFQLCGKAI